jgi:hypothetical protein
MIDLKMNILEYCNANTRDYTYIGIGSKNRYSDLEKFTSEIDQILPCFLATVTGTIRAIHFDPYFAPEHDNGFLDIYFKAKGFDKIDEYMWMKPDHRIEVLIIPQKFDDQNFLYGMMQQAIKYSTKLVVQRYTGQELSELFKGLYSWFPENNKKYIRNNILFDITYGTDCHCMTNMKEHAPMTDPAGNFYNFLLYDETEILKSIGLLPKMDKFIVRYFTSKLSGILNENHVNYRKAIRGEPQMFPSNHYPADCPPQVIMNHLLFEVDVIVKILDKLGVLTDEKKQIYSIYSTNYMEIDMYNWYSAMTKLYK